MLVWLGWAAGAAPDAELAWEDGRVRFSSPSPRVSAFELTVTLTQGELEASFRQPREVLGDSALLVPVELPDEPLDAKWASGEPVKLQVIAELLGADGQMLGMVAAPPRLLTWTGDPSRPIVLTEPRAAIRPAAR
jgi:hypothetical protein